MTKDEALKLALEALENIKNDPFKFDLKNGIDKAITVIKEALAQPEITTGNILMDSYNAMQSMKVEGPRHVVCQCDKCKAQPEQKPMHPQLKAMLEEYFDKCFAESAPQRTWVGLTDKEVNVIGSQWHFNLLDDKDKTDLFEFARTIEAKLKEKNT